MIGKFITLEGGEGTGKSTQAPRIAEFLQESGIQTHLTREPGGNHSAEQIRNLLVRGKVDRWTHQTEALLMIAARAEHWYNTIKPKLEQGVWVICDRFWDSTRAYQGYGHGISIDTIDMIHLEFMPGAMPDRTYIFDLDPELGLERAIARESDGETRFESMGLAFHHRVRQAFQTIAKSDEKRYKLIKASQEVDKVLQAITADLIEFIK